MTAAILRQARPAHGRATCRPTWCRSPSGSGSTTTISSRASSPPRSSAPRTPPSWSTASLVGDDRVTQFELLTAAAYSELARQGVEVAVIEAGLGGRYDATNVIPSRVQVLTSVGLEHTRWLGPTITAIATEKLDVVQPGATLVLGHGLHPDAETVAEQVAARARRDDRARRRRPGRAADRARIVPATQLRAGAGRCAGVPRASSTQTRSRPRRPRSSCRAGCRRSTRIRSRCSTAPTTPTGWPRSPRRSPSRGPPATTASSRSCRCSTTRTPRRCWRRCCRCATRSS